MDKNPRYEVDYRDVKHPRLEFKTGTLLVVLPKTAQTEKETLEKYRRWIQRKEHIIKKALDESQAKNLNQTRTDQQLRTLIHTLVQDYQAELNAKISNTYFKKMKTKWASHSTNGNLTINTLMRYLPEDLIQYITYHEITHAIERKHNENFWNIINKKFKDATNKEKDLLTYWFLIQKKS